MLAVNIASGFAQVQPGQYVGNGMLLAAAEKLDRSGAPVPQPASGTVTARVRLAYTGQQAFTQQRPVLTGACAERRTLTLLGRSWQLPGPAHCRRMFRPAYGGYRCAWGGWLCPAACRKPPVGHGKHRSRLSPRNRRSPGTAQRPPAIIAGLPRCRD